jgi:calcium-dependent protein kinase
VLDEAGHDVDEKSDVWSCGVILYVMLCGFVPYIGTNDSEIVEMIRNGRVSFGHP